MEGEKGHHKKGRGDKKKGLVHQGPHEKMDDEVEECLKRGDKKPKKPPPVDKKKPPIYNKPKVPNKPPHKKPTLDDEEKEKHEELKVLAEKQAQRKRDCASSLEK